MNAIQPKNKQNTLLSEHQSAVVVGLGLTGFSCVRYLLARGLHVSVTDSRKVTDYTEQLKTEYPQVDLYLGDLNQHVLNNAGLVVVSPGVPLKEPALVEASENGAVLIGDIELFVQENTAPVIAVTGSNGKSSVTALAGQICESAGLKTLVAGNIGIPVLDSLTSNEYYDVCVLELSSFQLEATNSVNASAAIILNVSDDHMDRYDSIGDYLLAKLRIFRGAEHVIIYRHDELLKQVSLPKDSLVTYGLDEPDDKHDFGVKKYSNREWLVKGDERLIKLDNIPLTGRHNVANVLAALALTEQLQLDMDKAVEAIKSFKGLPHRTELIRELDGVKWVNDSKATNIGATIAALQGMRENVILIAGGQGKGADFSELAATISDKVKCVILFGEDAGLIDQELSAVISTCLVADMKAAVDEASQLAGHNDVVLLSPACASFDMYAGFEERGDDFRRLVEGL